jgi:hypothetical protein
MLGKGMGSMSKYKLVKSYEGDLSVEVEVERVLDSGIIDLSRYAGDFFVTFPSGEIRIVPFPTFEKQYQVAYKTSDPFVHRLGEKKDTSLSSLTPQQQEACLLLCKGELLKGEGGFVINGVKIDPRTVGSLKRRGMLEETGRARWKLKPEWEERCPG